MEYNVYSLLFDFGYISLLLTLSTIMRAKIKLLQRLFIPSSLIAGLLGLVLGQQVLGLISFSSQASGYAFMFVILMFAAMKLGYSDVKVNPLSVIKRSVDTAMLTTGAGMFQFGIALVVGGLLLTPIMGNYKGQIFSTLMPAGFFGGHGYAVTIGGMYEEAGQMEGAISIAQTFATFGLLLAVILGVLIINVAVRKNWTRFVPSIDFDRMPISMRTGLVPKDEQHSMGRETTNPMSTDPLAFHLALIVFVAAMAQLTVNWLMEIFPAYSIPCIVVAMIYSFVLQKILNVIGIGKYVCKKVTSRISSSFTDFMVAFGVSTLNISVVVEYAVPLAIITALGVSTTMFYMFVISRKLYNSYWFERSIFTMGWSFGVLAMGVTLLRIVDPEFKSNTLEDYGSVYAFSGIVETAIVVFTPVITGAGFGLPFGIGLILATLVCWFICYKTYGIQKMNGDVPRPGEAEIEAMHR